MCQIRPGRWMILVYQLCSGTPIKSHFT